MKENHLLVIDDDIDVLHALKRLFINESYGIITVADMDEALEILGNEKIKVLICDQRMPNISGIEFFRKIKKSYPDIKRILITGYSDLTATQEAINIGEVYRYIHKPWDPVELKVSVYQAIQHYDLEKERQNLQKTTEEKNKELEILNKTLKAMYEVQKEFSTTVYQELRRPLATIKITMDEITALPAENLDEKQTNAINKVKQNADELNGLVNDILDVSNLEVEQLGLELKYHDITQVIQRILDETKDNRNDSLDIHFNRDDSELPQIPIDAEKINRVLLHLISNAAKFSGKKEGIEIFCHGHQDANYIEVGVQDKGEGIEEERVPLLFQKIHGAQNNGKNKGHWIGSSLSTCKEILKQHGGKIWVESEKGKGSCFRFILPVHERRKD